MSWWPVGQRPAGEKILQPLGVHEDVNGTPTVMMKLASGRHLSLDMQELADMCRHHDERLSCAATPEPDRDESKRERSAAQRAAIMLHNRYPAIAIPLVIIRPEAPASETVPTIEQQMQSQLVYERLMQKFSRSPSP